MSEITNLNRARKARAKAASAVQASENRIIFGRSKAQKNFARDHVAKSAASLDGHKRET